MMLALAVIAEFAIRTVQAEAPKPFYLPLSDIISKETQDRLKKKPKAIKSMKVFDDVTYDYSIFDGPIISQYRGDCTAQGLSSAADSILSRNGFKDPDLVSQESLWDRYKVYSADAAVKAWSKTKVKREAAWPFGKPTWNLPEEKSRYQLEKVTYLEDDGVKAFEAIAKGYPVYWAGSVSQGMASCFAEIGPNSKPTTGGHAVQLSGARVKNGAIQFLVKQSWGQNCGIKGYQWLPLSTCSQPNAYCLFWVVEAISDSVTGKVYKPQQPEPLPTPSPSPEVKIFKIEGIDYECKVK